MLISLLQRYGRLGLLVGLLVFSLGAGAQLNDTGVTAGTDDTGADHQCGRDPAAAAGVLPKVGSGVEGFDFTALDASGSATTPSSGANPHPCVRDNVTNLTWEVKTDDGGLRDKDHTYSWYNTDGTTNGGNADTQARLDSPGICGSTLTNCNTEEYVAAVNVLATALCGFSDWRMPTREELRSIVDYGKSPGPAIDSNFFPNTEPSFFWSASGFAGGSGFAWYLDFFNGVDGGGSKGNADSLFGWCAADSDLFIGPRSLVKTMHFSARL